MPAEGVPSWIAVDIRRQAFGGSARESQPGYKPNTMPRSLDLLSRGRYPPALTLEAGAETIIEGDLGMVLMGEVCRAGKMMEHSRRQRPYKRQGLHH